MNWATQTGRLLQKTLLAFFKWLEMRFIMPHSYLRTLFEESQLPESGWRPEGFDMDEDVFSNEPDREKML